MFIAEPQESHNASKRQNKDQRREGESLNEFFQDFKEGSDNERDIESTASASPAEGSSVTFITEISVGALTTFEAPCTSEREIAVTSSVSEFSDSYDIATCSTFEAFPFMKLPLSVRESVYEHLLVVPALICVRQNHTAYHDEKKAFLYAERRELLPGIAYALAQIKVDGFKTRFSRFPGINLGILRASKEVFTEARAIMYSQGEFEIVKPSSEQTPEPNYSVPLFPPGYQRLVTRLNIRIRTFYDLDWILSGGYNVMKNHYRGLNTLTLILELDSASKGFGRQCARKTDVKWTAHIERLRGELVKDLFENSKSKRAAHIPVWINLRVLFSGEAYVGTSSAPVDTAGLAVTSSTHHEQAKKDELRTALVEAFELCKRSGKSS